MRSSAAVTRIFIMGIFIVFAGLAGAQQGFPNKPIRFIVPFPPGGATGLLARIVGQKLTESWGQQLVVDNRAGGNTIIGTNALLNSAPDGYTIMIIVTTHLVIHNLLPKRPYDPVKDFAPISTLVRSELILVLHPSVPVNNLQELIAFAKARPGELNYASTGTGGPNHLAAELFKMMAGVKMQHIAYKGGGQVFPAIIGGQVQLTFNVPINLLPYINGGRLKAIAISGETRLSALPQLPTFTEAGFPGFDVSLWQGVVAPSGTRKAIINKMSSEIAKILLMPDIKERLVKQGMEPFISNSDQSAALIKADVAKYAKIIKTANIRLEN